MSTPWTEHAQAEGEAAFRDLVRPYVLSMPELTPSQVVDVALRLIAEGRSCYLCTRTPPVEDGVDEVAWHQSVDRHRLAHQGVRGLVVGLAKLSQTPVGQPRPAR